MQLFLSSYRFGDSADALVDMVGEDADVLVITNAKDYKTAEERRRSVKELFASFEEIGITPHELDLRHYFTGKTGLEETLKQYKFVWIAGGNTFVLRRALKASGADKLLVKLIYGNEIVYGGESAGAVIATPTLQGVEFGDDPYIIPEGYTDEDVWDGLHLVPYAIVPHYESEWEGADRMMQTLDEAGVDYKTLNDFQVLIVSDEGTERLP